MFWKKTCKEQFKIRTYSNYLDWKQKTTSDYKMSISQTKYFFIFTLLL